MLRYKHGKLSDGEYSELLSLNNHYESSMKRGDSKQKSLDTAIAANQVHSYLDLDVDKEQLVLMFAVVSSPFPTLYI
jgi:hypothetical protein